MKGYIHCDAPESELNLAAVAQSRECAVIKMLLLKWLPKQSRLSSLPCHLYPFPPVPKLASQNPPGLPQKIWQVPRPFKKGLCQQSLPLASSAIGMQRLMARAGGSPQTYVSVSHGMQSTSADCRMFHRSQEETGCFLHGHTKSHLTGPLSAVAEYA